MGTISHAESNEAEVVLRLAVSTLFVLMMVGFGGVGVHAWRELLGVERRRSERPTSEAR